MQQGDTAAAEQLMPLVYDELRKLAARRLTARKTRPDTASNCPRPRGIYSLAVEDIDNGPVFTGELDTPYPQRGNG